MSDTVTVEVEDSNPQPEVEAGAGTEVVAVAPVPVVIEPDSALIAAQIAEQGEHLRAEIMASESRSASAIAAVAQSVEVLTALVAAAAVEHVEDELPEPEPVADEDEIQPEARHWLEKKWSFGGRKKSD